MPGRKVIPLSLNKKHFTKAEREQRKEGEERMKGGSDKIRPPKWLDETARKEFRRIAKELIALDIICNADVGGLAIACDAYSKYIIATSAISKDTIDAKIVREGATATVVKTPLTAVEKYATIYRQYCAEYGLTPAARIKISVHAQAKEREDSPMAAFLKKRAGGNAP